MAGAINLKRAINAIDRGGTLFGVGGICLKRDRATTVQRYCWRRGVRNSDNPLGGRFIACRVSGGIGQRVDTRRGGIDINPFRSNSEQPLPNRRTIRQ